MGEMSGTEPVAQVVRKHAGWVYASARRRVRDNGMAEDVVQAVFLLYWRKQPGMATEGKLASWLYRATRYCSANAIRLKHIRQKHEREAAVERIRRSEALAGWSEIESELETALDRLSSRDREAVLLKFYRGMSLAEVGGALGIGEEAAKKRVQRALEKLRGMLQRRGLTGTSAGLSAVLVGNVVQEVPSQVVEGIMSAIEGGTSMVVSGIVKGVSKMMVFGKLKVASVGVLVLVGGVGVGVTLAQREPVQVSALAPSVAQTTQPSTPDPGSAVTDHASTQATISSLASTVQTVRSQLELYRLEHNGYPTIEQMSDWGVLLERHRSEAADRVVGPYLLKVPSNAFTGLTKVTDSRNIDGETGWALRKQVGAGRREVQVLCAVVPDTLAFRQRFPNTSWVIFSDKVSEVKMVTPTTQSATKP